MSNIRNGKRMSLELTFKEKVMSCVPDLAEIIRVKAMLVLVQGLSDMQIAQINYYYQSTLRAAWLNRRNRNLCNLIILVGILYAILLFPLMDALHLGEAIRTSITESSLLIGFGGVPLLLRWTKWDSFGRLYNERKWALLHTFEQFLSHLECGKTVEEAYTLWYVQAHKEKQDSDTKIKKNRSDFFGGMGHIHFDKSKE